jgi:tellurite resistance protein TerC
LLGYGLALIVMFIGGKMLIMDLYKIPIPWMLGTVLVILVVSIAASLLRPPRGPRIRDGAP